MYQVSFLYINFRRLRPHFEEDLSIQRSDAIPVNFGSFQPYTLKLFGSVLTEPKKSFGLDFRPVMLFFIYISVEQGYHISFHFKKKVSTGLGTSLPPLCPISRCCDTCDAACGPRGTQSRLGFCFLFYFLNKL